MNPRIEPTLEPAAAPVLRVDPELRMARPAPREPAGDSPLSWIFGLLLALIALVLMPIVGLRWLPPPTSSYMLQSPVKPVQYRWVPAASIAEPMRRAVVAAEDQKFWKHNGFDVDAIHKAEQYNLDHEHRRRGASTISQQTAKNMFLWPGGYVRKGIEAALTVLIEKIWGKDRILEIYLNIAEFGPGIYGVEAAAQNYFGKPASALTPEEAARLAAVLPNPRHWSVRDPGAYVQSRIAWIMGQMGYGAPGAPQEEPEPPASELPDADDADDVPEAVAPAVAAPTVVPPAPSAPAAAPQGAPADAAPPAAQAVQDENPPPAAAAPETQPPARTQLPQ
jgi:monofunctional biosynthetic peptidoglycan transglycosylase